MALFGLERAPLSPDDVTTPRLFLLQGLLLLALVLWFLLGYAGTVRQGLPAAFARQFGLRVRNPRGRRNFLQAICRWQAKLVFGPFVRDRRHRRGFWRGVWYVGEIILGLAAGVGGWVAVILLMLAVVAVVWALGGEELLPTEPPELIPWVAGLPLAVRAAIGLTAGVVEELFFRGFLQPRVGIALSSALFVLAHLSYDQPFMLVGIAALSLLFAALVRWRRNILPAIAAHAAFDLIQLLIVVPQVLKRLPEVAG
jgi:membrane protease YdiL (CAAX protease family)